MNNTAPRKAKAESFSTRLLDWYGKHARLMPWRVPPQDHAQGVRANPYHVWLSEVMLQQTQVATVKDYFLKFIAKWPTIEDLASSDLEDVLKAWAGLGYYSRARNLKKCADEIVASHAGSFPTTYAQLIKLPGIGDYTASAIAAIAFDQPLAVLDGNVERVMARHKRIEQTFPEAKTDTKQMLDAVLAKDMPGEFAQAMMDLGATICTPKRPACPLCPISIDCKSASRSDVETYPRKRSKAKKPTRKGAAYVLENSKGEIFLCKREEKGLLGGMTQVPTTNWTARQDGEVTSLAAPIQANWLNRGIAKHTFTHFHLELTVWFTRDNARPAINGWWCKQDALSEEALPTVMRKVIATAAG